MPTAYVVLILANVVYGSSYVVSRVVLEHMGPATLSLFRLIIGSLVLVPLARVERREAGRLSRADRWHVFWMGLLGALALHETLTPFTVAGGLLILAGVHVAVLAERAWRTRANGR